MAPLWRWQQPLILFCLLIQFSFHLLFWLLACVLVQLCHCHVLAVRGPSQFFWLKLLSGFKTYWFSSYWHLYFIVILNTSDWCDIKLSIVTVYLSLFFSAIGFCCLLLYPMLDTRQAVVLLSWIALHALGWSKSSSSSSSSPTQTPPQNNPTLESPRLRPPSPQPRNEKINLTHTQGFPVFIRVFVGFNFPWGGGCIVLERRGCTGTYVANK